MSTVMTCSCGRRFKVADKYRGKKVRCPACGEVSRIPADPDAGAADAADHADARAAVCPGCQKPVSSGGVICIDCGTDLRTGRQVATTTVHAAPVESSGGGSLSPSMRSLARHLAVGAGSGALCLVIWGLFDYWFDRTGDESLMLLLPVYGVFGAVCGTIVMGAAWGLGSALAGYVAGALVMGGQNALMLWLLGAGGGFSIAAAIVGGVWGLIFAWVVLSGIKHIDDLPDATPAGATGSE